MRSCSPRHAYARSLVCSAALLLCFLCDHSLLAQTEGTALAAKTVRAFETPALLVSIDEPLASATSREFTASDGVDWRKESVILARQAHFHRDIEGGPWTRVTFRTGEQREGEEGTLEVRLGMRGATDCIIQIKTLVRDDGLVDCNAALFDTTTEEGELKRILVADAVVDAADCSELTVDYRFGLIQVWDAGEQELLAGFVDNDSSIVGNVAFSSPTGGVQLSSWKQFSWSQKVDFTDEENAVLAKASQLEDEWFDSYRAGKARDALELATKVFELRRNILEPVHPSYAISLSNLAFLLNQLHEFDEAEAIYRQALALQTQTIGTSHPSHATTLSNIGVLYKEMGQSRNAEKALLECIAIRARVLGKAHPRYATALSNLATVYSDMGDFAKSEALYLECNEIRLKTIGEEHHSYATSLNNLATLYSSMSEYQKSLTAAQKALAIRKKVFGTEHPDYASSLNAVAVAYRELREFEKAVPLQLEAAEIRGKLLGKDHPIYATALNNLGGLYAEMGDYEQALEMLLKAAEIDEQVMGPSSLHCASNLDAIGYVHELRGEYALAEKNLRRSHQIILENAAASIPTLSAAQAHRWARDHQLGTNLLLTNMRNQDSKNGRAAYEYVWNSKALTSRLRADSVKRPDKNSRAEEVYLQLRDARNRLASLITAVPPPKYAADYQQALAAANTKKEQLEQSLADLSIDSRRGQQIRDCSVDDLLKLLPEGVAVVDFSRERIRYHRQEELKLPGGETRTVRSRVFVPEYHAFVLNNENQNPVSWVSLGESQGIDEAIVDWTSQLLSTGAEAIGGDGNSARDLLMRRVWEPLIPLLGEASTVVLMPDASLCLLPWGALPGEEQNPFLIQDRALVTAAYGQQLYGLLSDEPVQGSSDLLLAGGINYERRSPGTSADQGSGATAVTQLLASRSSGAEQERVQWSFLDGTVREVEKIAELWQNKGTVNRLAGIHADEASTARLLETSRYAHLATHGFFESSRKVYQSDLREQSANARSQARPDASVAARNPLLMSGIVLAGASLGPPLDELGLPTGDDGILTAEEIVSLDLRQTSLVTLSACESGLGDIEAGEGILGLRRALHQAGARSVVASLWDVDDAATEALMSEFYRNYFQRGLPKIQALQQAQLAMIERYDLSSATLQRGLGAKIVKVDDKPEPENRDRLLLAPRYWAAFQLSGDWR